ncbi:MAG: LLM class flavin-dependent oxidoreductase [Candidatus Tectomicrobia bacterium]|nr:LLM class flavin-dependent oxidoreductase [Candidatus Tectomicrobia bacterium]
MEFALSFYSLLDLPLKDIIDAIRRGEKAGVHYALVGQSAVRDGFIGLAQIANATKRIRLGTNVVPIYTRTPTDLAMSVITLNEATDGRFRLLGIGAGGRLKIEPNHGVKVDKTAERTKEYIEIIRGILAGKRLSYEGKFFRLDNAWIPQTHGVGTTASDLAQGQEVPIYVGATGPRVLRVAGAYADGVIFNSLSTPEYIEWAKGVIREGAEEAGRDPKEVKLGCSLVMAANKDPGKVKEAVQRACLYYLREDHHQFTMEKAGLGERHTRIRETYLKGDVDGALKLIDDEVMRKITFTGTPEEVRGKVREYGRLGISLAVIRNVVDKKTGKAPILDNIDAMAPLIG